MILYKFLLVIIATLTIYSCAFTNRIDQIPTNKLTYINSQRFSKEGEDNLRSVWSDMIDSHAQCDTAAYNNLTNYDIVGSFKNMRNDTLHIYNRRDSLFKVSRIDTTLLLSDGNILKIINILNRQVRYDTISNSNNDFKYTLYPDSIRNILGYQCLKLKIIQEEKPDETLSLGNEITEMWVTDKISLPPQVVFYPYPQLDLFPLIIISYSEKLKGMETVVECISIE